MQEIDVTVIIPAFNSEKYISRCLDSLLNQTLENIEIIVVDDGSTDKTKEICEMYSTKYANIKVYSKENEGQGIARNYGMKYACGKCIGFVDSDDYVENDMYESLYNNLLITNADMAYSYMVDESFLVDNAFFDYKNGIIAENSEQRNYFRKILLGGLPEDSEDCLLGISVCRSIYKRSIIKENRLEFKSERIVNSEDLLFNLNFIEKCTRICTVNGHYYHYCKDNPFSFSLRPNSNRFKMFNNLYDELIIMAKDDEETLRINRRYLANLRVLLVEKARWCRLENYVETRKEILNILSETRVHNVLTSYPLKNLPKMQMLYFYFMKIKCVPLLITAAKLRYKLL